MDFQGESDSSQHKKKKLKPPPNYSSRPVQYRLLLLVGMCMTILVVMNEARDPKNWYWMGFDRPGVLQPVESQQQGVSAKLPQNAPLPQKKPAHRTPGIEIPSIFAAPLSFPCQQPDRQQNDMLVRARWDGWAEVMQQLMQQDRKHFDHLGRALQAARDRQPLDPQYLPSWQQTKKQLANVWQQYLSEADSFLTGAIDDNEKVQLGEQEKQQWHTVLQQLRQEWENQIEPALRAIGQNQALASQQKNL